MSSNMQVQTEESSHLWIQPAMDEHKLLYRYHQRRIKVKASVIRMVAEILSLTLIKTNLFFDKGAK